MLDIIQKKVRNVITVELLKCYYHSKWTNRVNSIIWKDNAKRLNKNKRGYDFVEYTTDEIRAKIYCNENEYFADVKPNN